MNILSEIELYDLNRGEVDDFFSRIDAVTLERANQVIKKYYDSSGLTFLLLGNAAKFKDDLKKYGKMSSRYRSAGQGCASRLDQVPVPSQGGAEQEVAGPENRLNRLTSINGAMRFQRKAGRIRTTRSGPQAGQAAARSTSPLRQPTRPDVTI